MSPNQTFNNVQTNTLLHGYTNHPTTHTRAYNYIMPLSKEDAIQTKEKIEDQEIKTYTKTMDFITNTFLNINTSQTDYKINPQGQITWNSATYTSFSNVKNIIVPEN